MKDKTAHYLSDEEIADLNYQQEEMNNARWEDEESELPVINFNTLEPSEAVAEDLAAAWKDRLLAGNVDPLEFVAKKKCIELALEMLMKDKAVNNLMQDEISKHGKGGANVLGANITLRNMPKYIYGADAKWTEIKTRMAPIEQELKTQEELIKQSTKANASIVNEDGEVLASPVPAPASTSVCVSFKKK